MNNTNKIYQFGICALSLLVAGLLIILNIQLNSPLSAIGDDDPSNFIVIVQSDVAVSLSNYSKYIKAWGEIIFNTLTDGKNKLIPFFRVYPLYGFKVDKGLVFSIRPRAPPSDTVSFR